MASSAVCRFKPSVGLPDAAETVVLWDSTNGGRCRGLPHQDRFVADIYCSHAGTATAEWSADRGATWVAYDSVSVSAWAAGSQNLVEFAIGEYRDVRVSFTSGDDAQTTFLVLACLTDAEGSRVTLDALASVWVGLTSVLSGTAPGESVYISAGSPVPALAWSTAEIAAARAVTPASLRPPAGAAVYVDKAATGSADGSSWSDAYTTLRAAQIAAAADASIQTIYIRAGVYYGTEGWGSEGSALPQSIAYIGEPGVILSRAARPADLTWSDEGSGAWSCTLASAALVVDASAAADAHGVAPPLAAQTSLAAVQANAGSYWVDGDTVYVQTHDSREPDADVHAIVGTAVSAVAPDGGTVYFDSLSFWGIVDVAGDGRVVLNGCDCFYSPNNECLDANAIAECYLFDCRAAYGAADGYNYHGVGTERVVEHSCETWGLPTGGSNNGSTAHDGMAVARFGGDYAGGDDGAADVNGASVYCEGCTFRDGARSGAYIDGVAHYVECVFDGNLRDVVAAAGAEVYQDDCTTDAGVVPFVGAAYREGATVPVVGGEWEWEWTPLVEDAGATVTADTTQFAVPVLDGIQNLATWTRSNIGSVVRVVGPTGHDPHTLVTDTDDSGASTLHTLTATTALTGARTLRLRIKTGASPVVGVQIKITGAATDWRAVVRASDGVVTAVYGGAATVDPVPLGDGWYELALAVTLPAGGSTIRIALSDAVSGVSDGVPPYVGVGTGTIYLGVGLE